MYALIITIAHRARRIASRLEANAWQIVTTANNISTSTRHGYAGETRRESSPFRPYSIHEADNAAKPNDAALFVHFPKALPRPVGQPPVSVYLLLSSLLSPLHLGGLSVPLTSSVQEDLAPFKDYQWARSYGLSSVEKNNGH